MATQRREHLEDFEGFLLYTEMLNDESWRAMSQREHTTNVLLGEILWTDKAFRAWQSFYRGQHPNNRNPAAGEYRLLLSLDRDLCGWKDICHGGMLMTILDEAMQELAQTEMRGSSFTRQMTVTFEKPLALPVIIMARAWPETQQTENSRKVWLQCSIEDDGGTVYVTAKALFIRIKSSM